MEVDAGETECGRDERRRRLAIRPEAFAVEEELGVELARSLGGEHGLDGGHVHSEELVIRAKTPRRKRSCRYRGAREEIRPRDFDRSPVL